MFIMVINFFQLGTLKKERIKGELPRNLTSLQGHAGYQTIKQRDHGTNERHYQRVNQMPIREIISERQLKFTGYCNSMPADEPINRIVLYESKASHRPGAPIRKNRQQI